jgi:hypothetical protein
MRLLALAFVTVTLGQPLGPYSGDWTADFQGTTYVRLVLNDKGGTAQGAMSIGKSIHVDGQGNIDGVTEATSTLTPMLDVRRSGDVLSFSYRSGDNVDVDTFELRLIDSNTAELTLLLPEEARQELAADGIPLPRPFRLAKSRR